MLSYLRSGLPRPRWRTPDLSMFQCDETRRAPFPKRPPPTRVGKASDSTGGGRIATLITQAHHLDGQASPPLAVLSQTPPHQRPDGGDNASDHHDNSESEPTEVLSWSCSLPSSRPTDALGAPGDYLTYEGLGDRPILMLPDEEAPTDFQFRMGEFGSDAAVAAGGSADALGAAALQGGVSADAWEQKNGKIGFSASCRGTGASQARNPQRAKINTCGKTSNPARRCSFAYKSAFSGLYAPAVSRCSRDKKDNSPFRR